MNPQNLADKFISERVEVFGLNGSNTTKNPDAGFPQVTLRSDLCFSKGNHFKFGYNGEVGRFRQSSTCMFWTEHGQVRRALGDFDSELKEAAKEAVAEFGTLNLVYTGSAYCQTVMRAFSALPEQLNLIMPVSAGFDSAEDEVTHLGFKVQRKLFKWKDFENHLERSCKLIRATDPALSFSVFLSLDHDGPFIFENHLPRFVDLNFDVLQGCQVGPNNWCLEERESDMEAARMLMILGKSGVIDLLRFTPETLPALWCDYLVRKDDLTPPPAKSWTKLLEKLMSYERDLLARSPKAREAWHTPMARLAKRWQILNESFHRSNEDTYGLVF